MMLVVGLLAVATVAFAGLSVGVSPYAMVASALVASGVIAGRTRGGRKNRSTTRDPRRSASDELEKVTRAIDTVEEAIADLPSPDISVVLHTIALQAQILTDARYVALGFGTDPDRPLEPWIHLGMPPEVARALNRHPRPVGTLGRVACDGEVLRTQDVQRDPSFRGFPPGHPKMSSLLGVPIRFRGRAAGNLYLADKRGAAEFSEHDERLIVMLAARAGAAIETARLYAGEAQRHAWLRNTIDQMPEGLLLLDREGRTNAMNRALHAFLCEHAPDLAGFTSSKALDVRFPSGSPVPPEQLPSVRALQQGEVTTGMELVVRLTNGRLVPILANAAPVRDERGQISGAALIIQDISAMKDVERLREEWTSVVAHDLRQPASIIVLTAETIARSHPLELPADTRKGLDRISAAAKRLNRMIGDLLDASLLEARRLTLQCQTVDLGGLIQAVEEDNREAASDRCVRIVSDRGPLACSIDADRIRQVLQNLISNATKYARPGSEVRVEAVSRDDVVEVSVTNEGPGISREALPNLFSRFARTPEARAGGTSGLGLGLHIAKGLVEAHGGRIWVESAPGASTAFRFTLPKTQPTSQRRSAP